MPPPEQANIPSPRFLVLRGGAIGDLILTLPVLQALRAQWPDAHIEVVGYPRTNRLILAAGLADEVHSLDAARIAMLYVEDVDLPLDMARWLRAFTSIIHFLADEDGRITSNLKTRAKHVVAQSPMPPSGTHATDHYLFALQEIGVFDAPAFPAIELPPEQFASNVPHSANAIAIHPGSGGAHKNWPIDRFIAVAETLKNVVWIIGEADEAVAEQLPEEAGVWRDLSLPALGSHLAGCRFFLGNDSGIAHLAAAVGTPTMTLFGPSAPESWAPRGRGPVKVVRSPSGFIGDLTLERVLAELREFEMEHG